MVSDRLIVSFSAVISTTLIGMPGYRKLILSLVLWSAPLYILAQDSMVVNMAATHKSSKPFRVSAIPYAVFGLGIHFRHEPLLVTKYQLQEEIKDDLFSSYGSRADDFIQFLPSASPFILDMLKIPSYHNTRKRNLMMLEANVLTIGSVFLMKHSFHDVRPDGSDHYSFPSGHTTMAFTGAAILAKEYGKRYPWIKWTGYGVATLVGLSRIANNRHWGSDVIAGAALGIINTEFVYWLNRRMLTKSIRVPQRL